jgi:hypothetical protein
MYENGDIDSEDVYLACERRYHASVIKDIEASNMPEETKAHLKGIMESNLEYLLMAHGELV